VSFACKVAQTGQHRPSSRGLGWGHFREQKKNAGPRVAAKRAWRGTVYRMALRLPRRISRSLEAIEIAWLVSGALFAALVRGPDIPTVV
jgi:hypothetical protein